jgi:hypothetical protein
MADLLSDDQQRERLRLVMQDTADWQVLMVMSLPHGDMTVLVSPAPALRGYEIVSPLPGDPSYDIWKRDRYAPQVPKPGEFPVVLDPTLTLYRSSLTLPQLSDWLRDRTPTEEEFQAHGREWVEALMAFYHVPKLSPEEVARRREIDEMVGPLAELGERLKGQRLNFVFEPGGLWTGTGKPRVALTVSIMADDNVADPNTEIAHHIPEHAARVTYASNAFQVWRDGQMISSGLSESRVARFLQKEYDAQKRAFWILKRRGYSDAEMGRDLQHLSTEYPLAGGHPDRLADLMIEVLAYDDTPEVRARVRRLLGGQDD